jgi:hypothetical protein
MTHEHLARLLLDAVRAQQFESTPDALRGGAPLRHFPSIDLAVAVFPHGAPPLWANVLFSREHPQGVIADIGSDASAVRNVRFDADILDEASRSVAWLPEADWSHLAFPRLWGDGPYRFVAPYPASLFKLMVAVGVARAVDQQRCGWDEMIVQGGSRRSIAHCCRDMLAVSSNEAATALVALLHRVGALGGHGDALHQTFALYGLPTLAVRGTRADGGWGNAAGGGVGQLQMTAWDTVRLLWLFDAAAPRAPWLAPGTPALLSTQSTHHLRATLEEQALHVVLSSTALSGEAGWVAGLPARLPERWIDDDGAVHAGDWHFAADVRPAAAAARVRFAHKTGSTENYAADAGIVRDLGRRGAALRRGHYIVSLISNLGQRHAGGGACVTTWRLPGLGRTIDAALWRLLERKPL